jgi:hypothetical protein
MRSDLVFEVSSRISNRFLLCRMLAASVRKMHRDGVSTSQCINRSLLVLQQGRHELFENGPREEANQPEEPIAEPVAGT